MGNSTSQVTVANLTDKKLFIVTFSEQDNMYAYYRELRKVPAGIPEGIAVDIPGRNNAVKIGVIHDRYGDYVVYDLFRVKVNVRLCIQEIVDETGVAGWVPTPGVELLARGRSVKLGSDFAQLAMSEQRVAQEVKRLIEAERTSADQPADKL